MIACNADDEDCDGNFDEGDLSVDVDNCGACGNQCSFSNASPICVASQCELNQCNFGFGNADDFAGNGCECAILSHFEICNGIDDDCNGDVDDGNLCAQRFPSSTSPLQSSSIPLQISK